MFLSMSTLSKKTKQKNPKKTKPLSTKKPKNQYSLKSELNLLPSQDQNIINIVMHILQWQSYLQHKTCNKTQSTSASNKTEKNIYNTQLCLILCIKITNNTVACIISTNNMYSSHILHKYTVIYYSLSLCVEHKNMSSRLILYITCAQGKNKHLELVTGSITTSNVSESTPK